MWFSFVILQTKPEVDFLLFWQIRGCIEHYGKQTGYSDRWEEGHPTAGGQPGTGYYSNTLRISL